MTNHQKWSLRHHSTERKRISSLCSWEFKPTNSTLAKGRGPPHTWPTFWAWCSFPNSCFRSQEHLHTSRANQGYQGRLAREKRGFFHVILSYFGIRDELSVDDDDVFASSESDSNKLQIQKKDGQFRVRYKSTDKEEVICIKCLSSNLMSIVNVNSLLEKLLHISYQATLPIQGGQNRVSGGEGEYL